MSAKNTPWANETRHCSVHENLLPGLSESHACGAQETETQQPELGNDVRRACSLIRPAYTRATARRHPAEQNLRATPDDAHVLEERIEEQLTSGVMGLLTGPHHTSFSLSASFTIRLSEGDRPVLAPE